MDVHTAISHSGRQDQLDLEFVARLIGEYYDWLTDNGGIPPDELLSLPLTPKQRKLLLKDMDDVLVICGLTAEIRSDRRRGKRTNR